MRLRTGDHALERRENLDYSRKQRAFSQFIEQRTELQPAHCIARKAHIGLTEHVLEQLFFIHEQTLELARATRPGMLLALERRQNCAEQFRINEFAPIFALVNEPNEHLTCCRMFANTAFEHRIELSAFSGILKELRDLSDHSAMDRL